MLGILQAPPTTALWDRLKRENRLIENDTNYTGDANTLMNFIPTRPIAEIAREYMEAVWTLYDPQKYLKRCFDQCLQVSYTSDFESSEQFSLFKSLGFLAQLLWLQGICRPEIRSQFWSQLWTMWSQKPQMLSIYLGLCAIGEDFWEYRILARERIAEQLGCDPLDPPINQPPEKQLLRQSFS